MLTISYSQITILFKKNHINWYAEIKFKAVILSPCMQASLYTNISEYFKKLLKTDRLDWKQIYLLSRLVNLDSYSRSFQYKILNNVLYLNKKLFKFRKSTSPLCPFCKLSDETVLHLFYKCNIIQNVWNELDLFFENDFTLFDLTPQAAFLDSLNVDSKLLLIHNHLFLIFKYIFTILADLNP